jgi:hypothetical protein
MHSVDPQWLVEFEVDAIIRTKLSCPTRPMWELPLIRGRADGWLEAGKMIRRRYHDWLDGHGPCAASGGWPRVELGNVLPATYCIVAVQLRLGVLSPKISSVSARYWVSRCQQR